MTRSAAAPPVSGILVLDKPAGLSSASAAHKVKQLVRAARAGHGGTLDPLATGVLPVCLGAATKLAPFLLAEDKAYEAQAALGVETDTLDRTGAVTARRPEAAAAVTREALLAALAARRGEHDQVPPMYSAIKQDGVRLYARARAGEEVARPARRVRIDHLELVAFAPPMFTIAVACSKGTYIRSLVADLGADLGCGAHLTELRRTRAGRFGLDRAVTLAELARRAADGTLRDALGALLIPPAEATDLPRLVVGREWLLPIKHGLQVPLDRMGAPVTVDLERFQVVSEDGQLLAVAHAEAGRIAYDRVFGEHLSALLGP